MNRLAAPDAVVIVVDERTEDRLTVTPPDAAGTPGTGSDLEQLLYGFSLTVCLPDGLSHPGGFGTGTVMRPSTLANTLLMRDSRGWRACRSSMTCSASTGCTADRVLVNWQS